jgi:hypothetical protein
MKIVLSIIVGIVLSAISLTANSVPTAVTDSDFNANGTVDSNDASAFFAVYGMDALEQDFNNNGVVDSNDASVFFSVFGASYDIDAYTASVGSGNGNSSTSSTSSTSSIDVTEPGTFGLLLLGLGAALARRKTARNQSPNT